MAGRKKKITTDAPAPTPVVVVPDEPKRLNLSQLEFRFNLNRATVRKRLRNAGIEPVEEHEKEKIFLLNDELTECLKQTEEDIDEVKLRKERAAARIQEHKADLAEGVVVMASDVKNYLHGLFTGWQKEFTIAMPRRVAAKLARAKTAADVYAILTPELDRMFDTLRTNHKKFMPETVDAGSTKK